MIRFLNTDGYEKGLQSIWGRLLNRATHSPPGKPWAKGSSISLEVKILALRLKSQS